MAIAERSLRDPALDGCARVDGAPRTQRLYAQLLDTMMTPVEFWGDELTIFCHDPETNKQIAQLPLVIRESMAFELMLREMPIAINPDELVVGVIAQPHPKRGKPFPEFNTAAEKKRGRERRLAVWPHWGHCFPDYREIVKRGLRSYRDEAAERLAALTPETDPTGRKGWFYQAAIRTLEATRAFSLRHAELAREQAAATSDPIRRAELLEIAEISERVPWEAPKTFREAVQTQWTIHCVMHSTGNNCPAGRWDQYMWPFLQDDLAAGRTTMDEARELVEALWIKFNERTRMLPLLPDENPDEPGLWPVGNQGGYRKPIAFNYFGEVPVERDAGNPAMYNFWVQNIILSGQTPEGEDGTNELTYLALETSIKLPLTNPTISVRYWHKSPEKLLRLSAELARSGSGMPPMFNDDVFVPGYVKAGYPVEDAREYTNDGCWETLIGGQTEFRWNAIHALLNLELALNRGRSVVTGEQIGPDTGDYREFTTWEQLWDAFQIQLGDAVRRSIKGTSETYGELYTVGPAPFFSSILRGCLESGKDVTEGGAKYIIHALELTGGSNAADGLAAIKRFVFEERRVTLEQFMAALQANWEGHEELRRMVLSEVPKMGNDDDYVDQIAVDMLAFYASQVHHYNRVFHNPNVPQLQFIPGAGTFETYRIYGKKVAATPDGRFAGEPIATDFSPAPGRDAQGPLAAIRSFTKPDFSELTDGSELNLSMSRREVTGESGLDRLVEMMELFRERGGSILTITCNDVEDLRQAREDLQTRNDPFPRWLHLRMRTGGWSAYFLCLDPEHQEHHIQRYLHGQYA